MKSDNYVIIQGWMCNELELKGNELLVFALLYGFCQDGESCFSGSRSYIADTFNISLPTVDKAIEELRSKHLIEINKQSNNYCTYKVSLQAYKETLQACKDSLQPTCKVSLHNKDSNNKTSNKNLKEKDSDFSFGKVFDSEVKKIKDSESVDRFVSLYNEHCFNLPKVVKLTDKRRKAINAILKKYSTDEIIQAFDLANESDFLIGKNDRGWKADIDFILREDKFINILEGKYGCRKRTNTSHASSDMGRANAQYTAEQRKQFKEALRNGEAERI